MSSSLADRTRIACYLRYSSANQREASIADQLRRCREYIERHGGTVDEALVFADAAVSGASLEREAFEKMMALVDRRGVDAIVTEDLSRISRDLADSAFIFKKLQYLGIPLFGVADGIDTGAKHAKVTFTIKSLVSDLYLEELADKTRRGLEGRALAGFSTGGLPYGYKSTPVLDGRGGVVGHRVLVDEAQAETVRRIFSAYANGMSYSAIAGRLNADGVLPPRANTKHRKRGWTDSGIRAILLNACYVARWAFRKREWRKLPGTNKRRYRKRPDSEIIRREYPERRIISGELWDSVQLRLASVRAKYVRGSVTPKAPGHRTAYPLSGLLYCASCGASMVITGGSHARYYICGHAKARRTCTNRLTVREDVARRCILGAIRDQLRTPAAVDYLRKRIAERLGALARDRNRDLDERRPRFERTEARIAGLIQFISDGDRSDYVVSALKDLEAQANTEKREIEAILAQSRTPVRLPTAAQILERALDLEKVLSSDPLRAREALRRLLVDGKIALEPGADGVYVATFTFLAMVLVTGGAAGAAGVGVPLSVQLA